MQASMWNKEFLWFETLQRKDFILERANGGFWASYSTKTTYLAESLFVGLFNGLSWSHGQAWFKNVGSSFQVSLSAFATLPVELPSPHTPAVRVLHLLLCDGVDTNLQTPIGFRDIYKPCKHQCSNNLTDKGTQYIKIYNSHKQSWPNGDQTQRSICM